MIPYKIEWAKTRWAEDKKVSHRDCQAHGMPVYDLCPVVSGV